jgi:tetratricopeptide (TPR) repeat protein
MKTVEEYYQDIQPLIENEWYQSAICAYEQLLQTFPTFAKAHYDLGTLHYKCGDKDKAIECYHKAAEYDPDNIDYLKSLADYYHAELEQIEPALDVYKRIIEKGAADAETLFIAANLCVALHNFEDAATYYQKVLEIEPWHSEAFEFLEKIKSRQTMEVQAFSPEELYQKSQEAGATGNVESALAILEQLVERYPEYALARNDLGVYHQKLGNNNQAGNHYKKAVQLEPYNSTFKKNLADFCFIVQGDVTEALKIYLDVLKSEPDDIEVLLAAGHISTAVNRPQNAEIFYSRVLEIEPWNLAASENLNRLNKELRRANSAGL